MGNQGNYKDIMVLGSWLNRYLSPTLSPWDIEELVDDALRFLNIDHVRQDDDPVISAVIDLLRDEDLDEKIRNSAVARLTGPVAAGILDIKQYISPENYSEIDQRLIISDIDRTYGLPGLTQGILQELQKKPDTPWEYILSETRHELSLLKMLLEDYNSIREILVEKGRKIVVVNQMVFSDPIPGEKFFETAPERRWVRLPALVSRILISFLRYGGRDYCGLCKNCGQFILAERKGRRQFCSGRCRVAHKRREK